MRKFLNPPAPLVHLPILQLLIGFQTEEKERDWEQAEPYLLLIGGGQQRAAPQPARLVPSQICFCSVPDEGSLLGRHRERHQMSLVRGFGSVVDSETPKTCLRTRRNPFWSMYILQHGFQDSRIPGTPKAFDPLTGTLSENPPFWP